MFCSILESHNTYSVFLTKHKKLTPVPLWLKYALIIKDERIIKAAERANRKIDKLNEIPYREVTPTPTVGGGGGGGNVVVGSATGTVAAVAVSNPNILNMIKEKPMNGDVATMIGMIDDDHDRHPHHHHHNHHNSNNYQQTTTTATATATTTTTTTASTTTPQKNNTLLYSSKLYSPTTRVTKTLLVSASSPTPSSRRHHLHHRANHNNSNNNNSSSGNLNHHHLLKPLVSCAYDNESGDDGAGGASSIERDELVRGSCADNESPAMLAGSGTTTTAVDWLQMRDNLGKILKLLRRSVYILERNRLRQKVKHTE